MRKLEDEYNWEGVAEDLAKTAKIWLNRKRIGDPKFQPNERLIRDYVAKGILTKPERKGKEAFFGYVQLTQFLACRGMIEDGWPLSKIAEDFSVASHEDIMKLIPRESFENDAMGVVEDIKYNMLDYEPSVPSPAVRSVSAPAPSIKKPRDFSRRRRESYETRTDISEILRRLGSDFGNIIREDFTALQLATWLILFIDRQKLNSITQREAEDIGRALTAALLNKNYLSQANRDEYSSRMKELNKLNEEIKNKKYDLARFESEVERKIEELDKIKRQIK